MRTVAARLLGVPTMKAKPKAKRTGKPKAKRAGTTRGAQTAQGAQVKQDAAGDGGAHGETGAANRNGGTAKFSGAVLEQQAIFYAKKYLSELRNDCATLKFEIENALCNDGAGLLENEKIRIPLGRIAAIESWIKYFKFNEDMIAAMRDEVTARGRARVRETARLRERLTGKPERIETFADVPLSEIKQWYQIAYPDDWQVQFFNLSQMAFEQWFNFHVVPVLKLLKKWVEVAADLPQILRDAVAVENCKCHFIPASADNGGIAELGFNFGWINNFFAVAVLRDEKTKVCGKPEAASGAPSGDESGTPAHVAGDWATAQGVKNYNGECFSFKGLCLERKPKSEKQWADIAAIVESTEPDGAAMLGKNWRGKFSNADDEYKSFTRFIHPLPERGAGWFRLEKEKIAERRKW